MKGRIPITLLTLLILTTAGLGKQAWSGYTAPDKSFSVQFPGRTQVLANTTQKFHVQSVSGANKTIYMVTWAATPGASKLSQKQRIQALAAAQTAMARAAGMTIKASTKMTHASYLSGTIKGLPCWARMVLVGNRLYQLTVVAKKDPGKDRQKFISSFKVKSK